MGFASTLEAIRERLLDQAHTEAAGAQQISAEALNQGRRAAVQKYLTDCIGALDSVAQQGSTSCVDKLSSCEDELKMRLADAGMRIDEIRGPLEQFIRNVRSALSDDFEQIDRRTKELGAASIKLAESGMWAILIRHNQIIRLQNRLEEAKRIDGSDEIEILKRELAACKSRLRHNRAGRSDATKDHRS